VPEIFLVLVSYFEINSESYSTEAIFRKAGATDEVNRLQLHMSQGNYQYLANLKRKPHVVATYFK
jgi:hypothetical protein